MSRQVDHWITDEVVASEGSSAVRRDRGQDAVPVQLSEFRCDVGHRVRSESRVGGGPKPPVASGWFSTDTLTSGSPFSARLRASSVHEFTPASSQASLRKSGDQSRSIQSLAGGSHSGSASGLAAAEVRHRVMYAPLTRASCCVTAMHTVFLWGPGLWKPVLIPSTL